MTGTVEPSPERNAEILRLRESGRTYVSIAHDYGLSAGRISQIVWKGRRLRGDIMPLTRWQKQQQEEQRKESELTPEQRLARDEEWRRRLDEYERMIRDSRPPIDNSHIKFMCSLCDSTGQYLGNPCPDCKGD